MRAALILLALFGAPKEPEPEPEPEPEDAAPDAGERQAAGSQATPAEHEESGEAPPAAPRAPRFAEPLRVPPRAVDSPAPRPVPRYAGRQRLVRPTLRIAPGFVGRPTDRPHAGFGLEVLASVLVGLHPGPRQLGLGPELGYSLRAPGLAHDLLAGLSFVHGINADYATVGLLPRAVLRVSEEGLASGVRTGLWFDFRENGFSIELAHQWTRAHAPSQVEVADQHELRLSVGLDILMLAIVLNRRWEVGFI